ncbi:MAG: SPOR domain-containing protein [Actinomycetota bacterium]|nr:SPOR domain-containing protein [Actinomycetota bacterium]
MAKGILIIESDFEAARQMASALESEGYFVFTASTAESGLDMARRVKPSILFLSPSVEGLSENGVVEFIKELRSQDASKDIPVMLVTDGDKEYDPRYGTMYGIINFIQKPVDPAEVLFKCRASIEDVPEKPKKPGFETAEKIPAMNKAAGGYSEGGEAEGEGFQEIKKAADAADFQDFKEGGEGRPPAVPPESGPESAQPSLADPFEDILNGAQKEGADAMGPKWGSQDNDFMPFGQPRKRSGMGMKIVYVVLIVMAGAAVSFGVLRYMQARRNVIAKKEIKTSAMDNAPVIVQDTVPALAKSNTVNPAAVNAAASPVAANPAIVNSASSRAPAPIAPAAPASTAPVAIKPVKKQASNAVVQPVKAPAHIRPAIIRPKPAEKNEVARALATVRAQASKEGKAHSVQTGVFASRANALNLEKKLAAKGYTAFIRKASVRGRAVYRVLVGRYSTSAGAQKVERELKRQGYNAILK